MEALLVGDVGLVAAVALLLATLAGTRALRRPRRLREAAARERFEELVADVLVGDDPPPERLELDRFERRVLLDAGLAALLELRGRERDRIAALLAAGGAVEHEARRLRARSAAVRRQAADELGLIGSPAALEPLRAALGDPDPLVRVAAARGLAEVDAEHVAAAAPAIADAAVERGAGMVAELALALGARRPELLERLYRGSTAPEVRRIVVAAVGEQRLGAHAALLREALDAEDDELAARAARGLGLIGDVEAAPALIGLVVDTRRPWYVRSVATTALGQLGDPTAVEALAAELAENGEWARRRAAAEALAALGPDGEAALRRALEQPAGEVRELAEAALDR